MEPTEPTSTPEPNPPEPTIDQAFVTADTLIAQLKQQYEQIKQARQQLQSQSAQVLQEEVERLQKKLEELELDLAFTIVDSLGAAAREKLEELSRQESFWQFLRFAGLGFVLGILVKTLLR